MAKPDVLFDGGWWHIRLQRDGLLSLRYRVVCVGDCRSRRGCPDVAECAALGCGGECRSVPCAGHWHSLVSETFDGVLPVLFADVLRSHVYGVLDGITEARRVHGERVRRVRADFKAKHKKAVALARAKRGSRDIEPLLEELRRLAKGGEE